MGGGGRCALSRPVNPATNRRGGGGFGVAVARLCQQEGTHQKVDGVLGFVLVATPPITNRWCRKVRRKGY